MRFAIKPVGQGGGPTRRRPPYFRTKKLAIIGCTDSVQYTPWHDPSWTLASHASAYNFCKRAPDWWFDLHRKECWMQKKRWMDDYQTWLKTLQQPIFMQEAYPEFPSAVRFPKEQILAEFRPYFASHLAWMIALAMTEGITTIGLFGCQYKHESEYGVQRGSGEYWLGRFEQYGGHVVMPVEPHAMLHRPKGLYGYESHDEHGKLTAEYRTPARVEVPTGKTGKYELRDLTLCDKDASRPMLADLGVPINWEHSGFPIPAPVGA